MKEDLYKIIRSALQGVDPYLAVKRQVKRKGELLSVGGSRFDLNHFKRISIVGAGKAVIPMALAIEGLLGKRIDRGLVVIKDQPLESYEEDQAEKGPAPVTLLEHGYTPAPGKLKRVKVLETSHPIPDERGERAAKEMMELLKGLKERDLIICLLSGGASALLPAPIEGLSLADKRSVTEILLKCGANIQEINSIRKHLSQLKGGGMARLAYPATIITLILSDVIGDNLDVIGSGPTVGDPTTLKDCLDIVRKYKLEEKLPAVVLRQFQEGAESGMGIHETPKPGEPIFGKVTNVIVGNNFQALKRAAAESRKLGYKPLILTSCLEGEAREVGKVLGAIIKEIRKRGYPFRPPLCLLAGGETTVTISGEGRGGRNQELALSLGMSINGLNDIVIACMGTDGSDGPTPAAGALVDGDMVSRAAGLGLDCRQYLSDNNSYYFFKQLGDLLMTGPTGTNVMDIFVALIK